MSKKKLDPCKANACKIQACLSENHYQEEKCLHVLEEMRQCCVKWHKESFVCQGIDLERKYLPETETTTTTKSKTSDSKSKTSK